MDNLQTILNDPKRRASLQRRLNANIRIGGVDDCWEWTSKAVNKYGYGRMTAGRGVNLKSHRVAYALANNSSPGGLDVCHKCDNPPCCNPKHLFLGTAQDNIDDAKEKGRTKSPPVHTGERHHNAVISDEGVENIRNDRRSYTVLAALYNTTTKTIYRIKKRQTRRFTK